MVAANETMRLALAGATIALATRRDLWEILRGTEADMRTAGEEFLRWTSPATHVLRTALCDTELAGITVQAGDLIVAWLPAANRDEREFHRPWECDPTRRPNRQLAFGDGAHHCIGSVLARSELMVALRTITELATGVELLGPPEYLPSINTSGFKHVPMRLIPPIRGKWRRG